MTDRQTAWHQGDGNKTKTGDAVTRPGTNFKTDGVNSKPGDNTGVCSVLRYNWICPATGCGLVLSYYTRSGLQTSNCSLTQFLLYKAIGQR